jgi:hypothetical protein
VYRNLSAGLEHNSALTLKLPNFHGPFWQDAVSGQKRMAISGFHGCHSCRPFAMFMMRLVAGNT